MTASQKAALESLLPRYGIDRSCDDLRSGFQRPAPLVLEIGCGNGQALLWMAQNEPELNFVGIEVHEPGVGRLLRGVAEGGLANVRVMMADAVEVLAENCAPASLAGVRIYFPDPWPKKRHHKRRLIQPEFVQLVTERLEPGGLLHLATDWQPYAEWMLEVLAAAPDLENRGDPNVSRPSWRPRTHFEQRGQRKGHSISDLLFRRHQS